VAGPEAVPGEQGGELPAIGRIEAGQASRYVST
jgi:hypothetical protein